MTFNPFVGTKAPRGKMGGVTGANGKGMPLSGSANNAIGNRKNVQSGKQGNTFPIMPGTKSPTHGKFGTVTRKK